MSHVVYVHGLWMPGDESLILRRRLSADFGLTLHPFRYLATGTMSTITARLAQFVSELDLPAVHFVGHSLGGLVIHRFLEQFPQQPAGNAVFLGTPCVGSRAAERAARFGPVAKVMGQSVAEELLGSASATGGTRARLGSWRARSRSGWDSCWRALRKTTTARSA
jgi:pimeloyl-ACP methyl ester carboxylesterase